MKQLSSEEAIEFANKEKYRFMSKYEIAAWQLHQECLCMPFNVFHEAIEYTLGRPVFTHEFGINVENLKLELSNIEGIKEILEKLEV